MPDVDPHDDLLWNVVALWDAVGPGEDEGEDVERGAGSFPTETLAELWGKKKFLRNRFNRSVKSNT